MEGLRGKDHIHAFVRQAGLGGAAIHGDETGPGRKVLLGDCPHFSVGFNGVNLRAQIQELAGENARARTDIGYDTARAKVTVTGEVVNEGLRVRRARGLVDFGFACKFIGVIQGTSAPFRAFPGRCGTTQKPVLCGLAQGYRG